MSNKIITTPPQTYNFSPLTRKDLVIRAAGRRLREPRLVAALPEPKRQPESRSFSINGEIKTLEI